VPIRCQLICGKQQQEGEVLAKSFKGWVPSGATLTMNRQSGSQKEKTLLVAGERTLLRAEGALICEVQQSRSLSIRK